MRHEDGFYISIDQYSKDDEIEDILQELGSFLGRLRRAYQHGGELQERYFNEYCKPLNDLIEKAHDEYYDLFDDYHRGTPIDERTTQGKLHKYEHWGEFNCELGDKFAIIYDENEGAKDNET